LLGCDRARAGASEENREAAHEPARPRRIALRAIVFGRGGKGIVLGVLLVSGIAPAACGGSGSASSGATSSARRFIAAVTHGDTHAWCPQIDGALLGEPRQGRLATPLLEQCEQHDLFLITGNCDREAVIADASITATKASGDRAEVKLSTGALLRMRRVGHEWLVADITGGHSVRPPPAGLCSPAGGGSPGPVASAVSRSPGPVARAVSGELRAARAARHAPCRACGSTRACRRSPCRGPGRSRPWPGNGAPRSRSAWVPA
jgi:hypothetical protein